jgi:hypothetical protein
MCRMRRRGQRCTAQRRHWRPVALKWHILPPILELPQCTWGRASGIILVKIGSILASQSLKKSVGDPSDLLFATLQLPTHGEPYATSAAFRSKMRTTQHSNKISFQSTHNFTKNNKHRGNIILMLNSRPYVTSLIFTTQTIA